MKYYDIHVKYGKKDSDGYSIPIAIENGNEEDAIAKAKENDLFEYEEDIDDIDYVNEIDEEEYNEMICI